jgi:hypothetical protein
MRIDSCPNVDENDPDVVKNEASLLLQSTYRGFRIRKAVSLLFVERIFFVWDENTARCESRHYRLKLVCLTETDA